MNTEKQQIKGAKALVKIECKGNDYGASEYWDKRYEKRSQQRFQWLVDYKTIKDIVEENLKQDYTKKILNLGCGNASIQDQLYEDGYINITNNDISKIVIEQMEQIKKAKNYNQMIYEVMDVTKMTYPDKYFDLIIDKSTIDALLCSENPYISSAKMLEHVYRTLKDDGLYLMVSYGEPKDRLEHLERQHLNFKISVKKVEKATKDGKVTHWAYICYKDLSKEWKAQNQEWKQQFYAKLKQQQDYDYR